MNADSFFHGMEAVGIFVSAVASVVALFRIEQVHKATNGMKDELVAVTRTSAKAEGKLEGIAESGPK